LVTAYALRALGVKYVYLEGLLFQSCMCRFAARGQNTNTMEEGDRSEKLLSRYDERDRQPHS